MSPSFPYPIFSAFAIQLDDVRDLTSEGQPIDALIDLTFSNVTKTASFYWQIEEVFRVEPYNFFYFFFA